MGLLTNKKWREGHVLYLYGLNIPQAFDSKKMIHFIEKKLGNPKHEKVLKTHYSQRFEKVSL